MEKIRMKKFAPGSEVRVVRSVRNDGSIHDLKKGELLISAGTVGIVRSYGYFLQTQLIYQVFIPEINRVIGVRETEVIDAALDWVPCLFRSLDKAKLKRSLQMSGKRLANRGDIIEVYRVYRNLEDGSLAYEVKFGTDHVRLDASVLEPVTQEENVM
jgi:nitrogen fixation protein NifZ